MITCDKAIKIINSIVADPECKLCPEVKNKPKDGQCERAKCFDIIDKISKLIDEKTCKE